MLDFTRYDDRSPGPDLGSPTPGPWAEFCESGDWWIQQIDADGDPVGEIICASNDIRQANVALICAAPALLAACEAVLNSDMAAREEDEGRSSAVLALVRAAVAQARGGESQDG